ncbi:hypothetical protein LP316_01105 [Thalassotalea sp. LPB0316]|nr:hypothetical protein LP316_01105 [Thalassotalea sp. LPB0316]
MSAVVASLLATNTAFAHQQKAAETTVLFNKRSGHLEIMHRFYLHDTEHAVQDLFNDKHADILDSEKTQQQFADYVSQQFYAKTLTDQTITLNTVGFEVDGKFFWVYQDAPLPKTEKGLKLYNGALRDLWPTQINMVNVEGQGPVKTLYFQDNKDWLAVYF